MYSLETFDYYVKALATSMPLEVFVFVGSFLEEVISPIPAALVMGLSGSLALMQGETIWYLFFLALLGNIGKTLGAWLYYFLGDTLEDLLVKPITKYLGIRHEEIESFGKRFTGHHWKDGGLLFLLRLLPPFPTTPVSLAAGIIKMDIRVFLCATYAGNFFKDFAYLYVGYAGIGTVQKIWRDIEHIKPNVDILIGVIIVSFLFFLYVYRGAGQSLINAVGIFLKRWL
ncbi:MAG: VTT domain-containing protein [Candidatus Moranbacteria bacterium]|nr:VTT domain-containing protein [Candidatus Moranbacteria bacterium]